MQTKIKALANYCYNKWLKEYDSSEDFGDSTTFSGAENDIIKGNYEDASKDYPNTSGFSVPEVAVVYITSNVSVYNRIINEYDNYKEYIIGNLFIIIVW